MNSICKTTYFWETIAILGKGFISCLISSDNRNLELLCFQKIYTLLGVLWNVWREAATTRGCRLGNTDILNPKLSFPLHKPNISTQLTLFYADKVTCNTERVTQTKTEKLTFSLAAMKLCNSVLRATPAARSNYFFRAARNQYIFGWKNPFAFPPKNCPLL